MEQQAVLAVARPFPQATKASEFGAATFGAEHVMEALVEYQVEGLRFMARRTHANLEFIRHLPQCEGWQDLGALQHAWLKELLADYGEEVGRLAGTSFQLAMSGFVPMQGLFYRARLMKRPQRGNGRA